MCAPREHEVNTASNAMSTSDCTSDATLEDAIDSIHSYLNDLWCAVYAKLELKSNALPLQFWEMRLQQMKESRPIVEKELCYDVKLYSNCCTDDLLIGDEMLMLETHLENIVNSYKRSKFER